MKVFILSALVTLFVLQASNLVAQQDNVAEPDIVIKEMADKTIHEYRVNGMLYAIKVIPKSGQPYFLVAEEGGEHFIRLDEPRMLVPTWEIFKW